MIDFDEEVSKFQPSMEIEKVEDTVSDEKLTDISDIIKGLARNLQGMQSAQIDRKVREIQNSLINYEE